MPRKSHGVGKKIMKNLKNPLPIRRERGIVIQHEKYIRNGSIEKKGYFHEHWEEKRKNGRIPQNEPTFPHQSTDVVLKFGGDSV